MSNRYSAPVWENGSGTPINAENLQAISDTLEDAQVMPSVSTITLLADNWNEYNEYSFESTYPHEDYNIEISTSDTMSVTQLEAFSSALIVGSATLNKIVAKGEKPVIDIPVIITVWEK